MSGVSVSPAHAYGLALADGARWCLRANALCDHGPIRGFFAIVSRLGDGVFWYALMGALALFGGRVGLSAALHMAAISLVSLLLYKGLKRWTRRPRCTG